jgi:hypothetical protein
MPYIRSGFMVFLHIMVSRQEPLVYYIQARADSPPPPIVSFTKIQMKPYSYYQTTSVSLPTKDKYMTIYYYRRGVMVGMKKQFDDDFEPPANCVEERVLDEVSYQAHLKHYHEENKRLQDEFRKDLIAKYNMTEHPKANDCFDKAWDFGSSAGLREVEDYFMSLIEIFDDVLVNNYGNI